MNVIATVILDPGGILAWLTVGLISGCLAGSIMGSGGYGVVGDVIIGLVGAVGGGLLFSYLMNATEGFWGSLLVAVLGACVLIGIYRAFTPGRTRT
jgi:uncharacterized membrane protein YeaQ/YmgE (transglycosylase-associated protein family)